VPNPKEREFRKPINAKYLVPDKKKLKPLENNKLTAEILG